MLVLSRKVGEKICIGDGVTIVVNRVQGNRVSLAIEAPMETRIVRGELRVNGDEPAPTAKRTFGGAEIATAYAKPARG